MRNLSEKQRKSLNAASLQVLNEGFLGIKAPSRLDDDGSLFTGFYNKFVGPRTSAAREETAQRSIANDVSIIRNGQNIDNMAQHVESFINDPNHPHYNSDSFVNARQHFTNAVGAGTEHERRQHHVRGLTALGMNPLSESTDDESQDAKKTKPQKPKTLLGTFGGQLRTAAQGTMLRPLLIPTIGAIASIANAQLKKANISNFLKGMGAGE